MKSVDKDLFQSYKNHYNALSGLIESIPDDIKRTQRDRLPRCLKPIPKDAPILDLGCAEGRLMEILQRCGYINATGVDVSEALIEIAKKNLSPNTKLFTADIFDFLKASDPSQYKVVFLNDVLEHIHREHVLELLRLIYRALEKGGILRLRVPNMSNIIATHVGHIDFTHITHFNESSLVQVLENSGFIRTEIVFEKQNPLLFWSWKEPHRAFFRLLNRIRWDLNNFIHRGIYLLQDAITMPKIFDLDLICVAKK